MLITLNESSNLLITQSFVAKKQGCSPARLSPRGVKGHPVSVGVMVCEIKPSRSAAPAEKVIYSIRSNHSKLLPRSHEVLLTNSSCQCESGAASPTQSGGSTVATREEDVTLDCFFLFFEELNKNFGTSSTVSFRLIHHLHISSAGIVRLFYLQKIFFSPLFIYSEAALWYIWPYERSSPSGCTALMSHCQLGHRTWSTFICLRLSKQSSGKEKEKHTGGQQRCIW